jgi:hypothetical protein
MFLCGLDADDQPTAINLAGARSIVLVRYDDGDVLMVEFSDSEVSRSVQAVGASVCEAAMLIPVIDYLSQKSRKP